MSDKQHYSYQEYARRDTAENFENLRFGGPVGGLMRRIQEDQLRRWIPRPAGRRIADIGAGTGRTAIPLAHQGAIVTGADASDAMLEVARKNAEEAGVDVRFTTADALNLPFEDRAFDTVLSFRLLLHVTDWRTAFDQICRISAEDVIIDFPPRWSLAALQVPWRAIKAVFDKRTQNFRLFSLRQIRRAFHENGFRIVEVEKLWALPIAFHKLFGSVGFTKNTEKVLAALGLRYLFGAPVTVRAKRN